MDENARRLALLVDRNEQTIRTALYRFGAEYLADTITALVNAATYEAYETEDFDDWAPVKLNPNGAPSDPRSVAQRPDWFECQECGWTRGHHPECKENTIVLWTRKE